MARALDGFATAEGLKRGLAYRPEPTDVFISPYSTCGTTWMQQIVHGRRTGIDSERGLLQSGASATLQAIDELLRLGGWRERHDGDLRPAGACRVRAGQQDLVVVLAEAIMSGHRVPLAGATPIDGGLDRASITATLQATNALVAERAAAIARAGGARGDAATEGWVEA